MLISRKNDSNNSKLTINSNLLIVGAGPAGLAMAGRLRNANADFDIIEKENAVGFMWNQHYDRLHLHTVKNRSALPHFPFPDEYPMFVPKDDLYKYYQEYAQRFNIQPSFGETLISVSKNESDWKVTTNKKERLYKYVIFATNHCSRAKIKKRKNLMSYFLNL